MEQEAQIVAVILIIIGLIAMMVNIIMEVTKNIIIFSKIPKDIKIVVLSLSLCLFVYFAYISYTHIAIIWYYVIGSVIASFIVSFIVMYGWNKLVSLYKNFRNIPKFDSTINYSADIVTNNSTQNDTEIDTENNTEIKNNTKQ